MRGLTEAVLPDILEPNLRVVFCGSAAGAASARAGANYAGPGNKFWSILHHTGLTNRHLAAEEFSDLPEFGIGLTDLAKRVSGSDASLPRDGDDPAALQQKIHCYKPGLLAFNGKRAAQVYLNHQFGASNIDYGAQRWTIGNTFIHILPSTSGQPTAIGTKPLGSHLPAR